MPTPTLENKDTTVVLLTELNEAKSKRQTHETSVVNIKVNGLGCPSLGIAINLLKDTKNEKKDNSNSVTQFFDELGHKYRFTCTSDNPEQPTPETIYIKVV